VTTFSGIHAFRRACVVEAIRDEIAMIGLEFPTVFVADACTVEEIADAVVDNIDAGLCPRCGAQFPANPNWMPAGSRVTACRCIPVCATCGDREAYDLVGPLRWPLDECENEEVDDLLARRVPLDAILSDDALIDAAGAHQLVPRPHPGGWAEHGFDEAE
jgi:hypothetical protein